MYDEYYQQPMYAPVQQPQMQWLPVPEQDQGQQMQDAASGMMSMYGSLKDRFKKPKDSTMTDSPMPKGLFGMGGFGGESFNA